MTTDLGILFRAGQAASGNWTSADVQQALEVLVDPKSRIDWEPGDEEWGRIVDTDGCVLALVCVRVPVGVVREDVNATRMSDRVSWLRFKSMTDRAFQIDRRLLEQLFGRRLSDNVDYSRLSLNDLWWATVS
jgi:hypothetical protein